MSRVVGEHAVDGVPGQELGSPKLQRFHPSRGAGEVMSVGGRGRYARTKFQSFVLGTLFLLLTGHDSIRLRLPSKFDATQQKLELELHGSCAQSACCSCPLPSMCRQLQRSGTLLRSTPGSGLRSSTPPSEAVALPANYCRRPPPSIRGLYDGQLRQTC